MDKSKRIRYSSPASAELREKYHTRSMRARLGDSVKIVRGEFKGIEGKITGLDTRQGKLYIEGVTREKIAGGKTSPVPIDASKVMITSLNLEDKLRKQRLEKESGISEVAS